MLVNFVIVLSLLIGFCGLAIDVGMLELKKVQLQNAADAAVLGAVYEHGRGTTNWKKDGGLADAGLNGFTNAVNNVTVAIYNPPASGSFSSNTNAVQAVVTQQVGPSFMGGSYTLAAQAVSLLPPPPCLMYLLSTTANNTLNISANSTLTSACSVYIGLNINEDSSSTITTTGSNTGFNVVGSASSSNLNGGTTPTPTFNYPVRSDPLAAIVQPVFSGCDFNGAANNNVSRTLSPGTYCNNSIQCSGNATLTLNAGLYIVTGGVNWSHCTIMGTGVTLFLTQGGGYHFNQFNVTSSTVQLSAPTDNPQGNPPGIPGILLFMDRSWQGGNQDVQLHHSNYNGDGIFYSLNTGMQIESTPMSSSNYMGFVVNNLQIQSSTVNAPYANAPIALVGSSSAPAGLVE